MGDTLAAIDVGTNSLHLVVARVAGEGRFEVIEREKETVRLGSGAGDMKRLAPEAIDRGVAALSRFRQVADIWDAPVRAVATSALREADNRDEFLRRARDEAGVEVEVISGVEEARLIHLGALQAVPVYDEQALFIDVGGGSTEIVLGLRAEELGVRSFKLGHLRLTDRFFPGEHLHPGAVSACRRWVEAAVAPFAREVERLGGFSIAVVSSGTAAALTAMVRVQRGDPEPRTYNNYEFTTKELREVVRRLAAAPTVASRRRIPGLDPARADVILAGGIILDEVLAAFGARRVVFSDYALREGVLLDTLQRTRGGSLHHLADVGRRSVRHLAAQCDPEPEHSAHVAALALELFDRTSHLHGLDDSCRDYLEAGALLANVGLVISHTKHHLHSYYVIRNSDRLTGFTDGEIEVIAQIARYHRKSAPKATHPEFAALGKEDQQVVRTLAAILRIAIGLDRRHEARVRGIDVIDRGRELHLVIRPAPEAADVELERYAADTRKALFEEVFDRSVTLEVAR